MPGYFGTFVATIFLLVLFEDNVTNYRAMIRPMAQIFLVLYVILQNVVMYSLLAALIKIFPKYSTVFALLFGAVRANQSSCAQTRAGCTAA